MPFAGRPLEPLCGVAIVLSNALALPSCPTKLELGLGMPLVGYCKPPLRGRSIVYVGTLSKLAGATEPELCLRFTRVGQPLLGRQTPRCQFAVVSLRAQPVQKEPHETGLCPAAILLRRAQPPTHGLSAVPLDSPALLVQAPEAESRFGVTLTGRHRPSLPKVAVVSLDAPAFASPESKFDLFVCIAPFGRLYRSIDLGFPQGAFPRSIDRRFGVSLPNSPIRADPSLERNACSEGVAPWPFVG